MKSILQWNPDERRLFVLGETIGEEDARDGREASWIAHGIPGKGELTPWAFGYISGMARTVCALPKGKLL